MRHLLAIVMVLAAGCGREASDALDPSWDTTVDFTVSVERVTCEEHEFASSTPGEDTVWCTWTCAAWEGRMVSFRLTVPWGEQTGFGDPETAEGICFRAPSKTGG